MIAFLHTVQQLKSKFENLVKEHSDDITVKHFVKEDLLTNALKNGKSDDILFNECIDEILKEKPKMIICTCSSYGESSDQLTNVLRIDRPIAQYIVANFSKIGMAFTATSTKVISENLLLSEASKINKTIDILPIDCSNAWKYYESKDFDKYERSIAETINENYKKVDVIFIAQASMQGAIKLLEHIDKPMLTSPEYGVKSFVQTYLKQ